MAWSPAVPYVQLLSMVGLFYPLTMINQNMILAVGHSDLYFRLEVVKKALTVIAIAITWRWSIEALIWGQIAVAMAVYCLNSRYGGTIIGYGFGAQSRDLLPYLGAACVMGAAVFMLNRLPFTHPAVLLAAQVILGVLVYGLLCRRFRLPVFMDAWTVFQGRIVALRVARS